MKRRITVGLVAAVAALGVAGCGGDDDEDNGSSDDETTEETTTETGATGAEDSTEGTDVPEGTDEVADIIEQGLIAQGTYSEGEAACLADTLSEQFADADVTELQDPEFLGNLSEEYASEIQECEGQ